MAFPFFTIGHSNRSLEELVELLRGGDIFLVADIRKIPRSRANPQFNKDTLPEALEAYTFPMNTWQPSAVFAGRANLISGVNGFWTNKSFHNYADYALTNRFQAGLKHLLDEGRKRRCTIMCSEAVWWRCHRRIVADYLIASGKPFSTLWGGAAWSRSPYSGAVVQSCGTIVYPIAHMSAVSTNETE